MPRLKRKRLKMCFSADAEARRIAKEEVAALTGIAKSRVRKREGRSKSSMNMMLGMCWCWALMILVHEWAISSWRGCLAWRVDVFSIGFGPRLFGWKRGATDYRSARCRLADMCGWRDRI